jgi:hypothetical protein
MYNGGSLWTDAVDFFSVSEWPNLSSNQNTIEDLYNLLLATGTNDFASVADNSFIGSSAKNANTNWASILGGSNDDAGVCYPFRFHASKSY